MDVINWIQVNMGSVIAGAAVAIAAALALRSIWKRRRTGGCGCGCSGCSNTRSGPSSDAGSNANGGRSCAGCMAPRTDDGPV